MTDAQFFVVAIVLVVAFFLIRAMYRRLSFSRAERAFLSLAASRGLDLARAMHFVNLARARGTTALAEVTAEATAMDNNDLRLVRQQAGIAVMERTARDEFRRLTLEGNLKSFEEISGAADAAGIAMLNQYVEAGGPLAEDSPMGVAALRALIDNCNNDLHGIPEGEEYVTQLGRVARAGAANERQRRRG